MIIARAKDFDPGQIARSGQCFRMSPRETEEGTVFCVTAGERYLELSREGERVFLSCDAGEWDRFWRGYFDWDADYGAWKAAIDPADEYLNAAASFGGGIRILRQDVWETVISFILSQQSNIPRIRGCVAKLCERFGAEKENFRGERYYAFPTPERLAAASEEELAACRLGYRGRYVLETARAAAEGRIDLDGLRGLEYEEAREKLMGLCGVGIKVAECVCLFALHHIDAFPVDTHIRAVLERHYPQGFPFARYRGFAGVLQQYSFYYETQARGGTPSGAVPR